MVGEKIEGVKERSIARGRQEVSPGSPVTLLLPAHGDRLGSVRARYARDHVAPVLREDALRRCHGGIVRRLGVLECAHANILPALEALADVGSPGRASRT